MARFKIYSKDGKSIRYEGKPRYFGTYLKPSYLEFPTIASPTPIAWEVGDYLDYSRTGMRYYLYSLPQPSKNARKGANGGSFTYSNVQLYSATKDLEIALFRDLVDNDNNIHFSTSPDVVTFENVEGIARRIQACMDDLYPNKWDIRIADFDAIEDAEVIEKIAEAKDFALSGGTCLDALSKIYELWEDIGWFHSYDSSTGKEVITIGYSNRRNAENTTESYLYGKGNGLTAIKRNQTNRDEFATRLYVYGSERNLPARYYNEKNILNAESVNIRNLMLPIEKWGKTNGKPDARLAYLENASAVAKFGIIPKVHYFDSEDAGADIYPSVERMTIGKVRKALAALNQQEYIPNASIYPDDNERVDEVRSSSNAKDDGVINPEGKAYNASEIVDISIDNQVIEIPENSTTTVSLYPALTLVDTTLAGEGKAKVKIEPKGSTFVVVASNLEKVEAEFVVTDNLAENRRTTLTKKTVSATRDGDVWMINVPTIIAEYAAISYQSFHVVMTMLVKITPQSGDARSAILSQAFAKVLVGYNTILEKTFSLSLKQIGFDINERAAIGEGKTISMKSGLCEGRNFEIVSCEYKETTDSWEIVCNRQKDKALGILFPNTTSQIANGDRFVLLDIAMPEIYIVANSYDLLDEGQKLLARASKIQTHYEPSIDAKVMIESGRSLREGMFMEITDEDVIDNTTDYILIDTLSIYEDESAIPTYKVTLRERRKVTYKGTPSATSTTDVSSAEDDELPSIKENVESLLQRVAELEKMVKELQENSETNI